MIDPLMPADPSDATPVDPPDKQGAARHAGNIKVTRDDWLFLALDLLISHGIEHVRVLTLSERLGVSRSSFYWYFKNRKDLLDALLEHWEALNTQAIVHAADAPAQTITAGICNLFRCFVDASLFNPKLDFAVREWSRRSEAVHAIVEQNDRTRVQAIKALFERHDYDPSEAIVRARVVYYMQIGYYALEIQESMETRLSFIEGYLLSFTGQAPLRSEVAEFEAYVRSQVMRRT